ncbi:MAG: acetyltransferase [Clostridia bacterium]|nr:acetyltransferase [Clostridia bacterium]
MKQLLIIGAGGLGREVAWLVERINHASAAFELLGFLDDAPELAGCKVNGYPVLGSVADIVRYPKAHVVCAIANTAVRRRLVAQILQVAPQTTFAALIDPSVECSRWVTIGQGSIICLHTSLTVNITIGEHVIINPACTVGHDAILEDFVTVYPGANLSGSTRIGTGAELGTGMQIIQGKHIGAEAIIGAGAVVVRDIPPHCTAVGCPAKPIK